MLKNHLLPLNLQFFAADTGGDGGSGGSTEGGQTQEGAKSNETKTENKEHMIPKSRFDEVNKSFQSVKAELDKLKAAQTKAEQERQEKEKEEAEKRGEFESLYNKTKSDLEALQGVSKNAQERVEALEGVIQGLLDAKLEAIDKEYHDLIPENMTPEQKLAWVTNAEAKGIFGNRQASTPLGEPTNPKGKEEVDVNKMNPLQMILSGYGKK